MLHPLRQPRFCRSLQANGYTADESALQEVTPTEGSLDRTTDIAEKVHVYDYKTRFSLPSFLPCHCVGPSVSLSLSLSLPRSLALSLSLSPFLSRSYTYIHLCIYVHTCMYIDIHICMYMSIYIHAGF